MEKGIITSKSGLYTCFTLLQIIHFAFSLRNRQGISNMELNNGYYFSRVASSCADRIGMHGNMQRLACLRYTGGICSNA